MVNIKQEDNMEKITEEQVMLWVGNEGYYQKQKQDMLETICLIANGKYTPKLLREEIECYWQNYHDEE